MIEIMLWKFLWTYQKNHAIENHTMENHVMEGITVMARQGKKSQQGSRRSKVV